jgi:hypothetical protein
VMQIARPKRPLPKKRRRILSRPELAFVFERHSSQFLRHLSLLIHCLRFGLPALPSIVQIAAASWVGVAGRRNQSLGRRGLRERCPWNRFEMGQNDGFLVWETAQPGTIGFWRWNGCKKDRERRQPMVHWFAAERQNGNSCPDTRIRILAPNLVHAPFRRREDALLVQTPQPPIPR